MVLEEVDSTMAEAARRAPDLTAPLWILAKHQTAAKGRRGRAWHMPEGNLAATLVLPKPGTALAAAQRSFVAALALDDLFRMQLSRDRVTLKWPNDVLIDGRKAAGILLEAAGTGSGDPSHLAIGIGVNLRAAPAPEVLEPGALPPVALSEVTTPMPVEQAFDWLAWYFEQFDSLFRKGGFDPIRKAWLDRAARLGQTITARTGQTEHRGIFDTIDTDGALVLLTPGGRTVIPAGDVFF